MSVSYSVLGTKLVSEWPYAVNRDNVLGKGAYSVVYGGRRSEDGGAVALKVVEKASLDKSAQLRLRREVELHSSLRHQHIVALLDSFETDEHVVLVLEPMHGGELFDRIVAKHSFPESEAAALFRVLVAAVDALHADGIAHRDLKPENLLFTDASDDALLKIADFGLAKQTGADEPLLTPCGTPGYIASEVAKLEPYTLAVDCWALGVILYTMLVGFPPFYSASTSKLLRKVKRGQYSFPSPYWDPVSANAKDLVRGLICVDPNERLTAAAALAHPWLATPPPASPPSADLVSPDTMRIFSARSAREGAHEVNVALALAIEAQRAAESPGDADAVPALTASSLWQRRHGNPPSPTPADPVAGMDVCVSPQPAPSPPDDGVDLQPLAEDDLDDEVSALIQPLDP